MSDLEVIAIAGKLGILGDTFYLEHAPEGS